MSLGDGQVAGGCAVDHAGEEDHPQAVGEGQYQEADERADLAEDQQRLAAEAVGQLPEDGAG
jgi:hypothetical protein